jgi:hypothetical protein
MGKIHHAAGEDSIESRQTCPGSCLCPSPPHIFSRTPIDLGLDSTVQGSGREESLDGF